MKQKTKITKKQQEVTSKSLYDKTNDFFERNQKIFLVISMIAGALMCILLFDVKVSQSGDDSEYLINAENFWRYFRYPGSFGALYPIVIAPIVGLLGYKLILLKSLSCLFMLTFLWLFYKSFREKISSAVLFPAMLLISINSYVFYYAGQTYSESFFMLTQGLFFVYFLKHFIDNNENTVCLKSDWKKYLILGCLILMMGLTRMIGYGAIGVLILFFAVKRRWKDLVYSTIAFMAVFVLFQTIKYVVWPDAGSGYDLNTILAKDHYNPTERDSFTGFCMRFIVNSQSYLSNFLCQFLGVIKEQPSNYHDINIFRTILLYLLFFGCLIILFKKNNPLLFSGIYVGVLLFCSFIVLHTIWLQDRFIMVYYPFILLFLLGGLFYLFQIKTLQKFFFIYPLILISLCFGTLSISKNRIERNIPVLQENLFGNQLFGLTPDWQNFINASQWAAQNLDKNAVIVSRKPGISKVYTGRDFVWAPTDITVPSDSLTMLQNLSDQTVVIVFNFFQSPNLKYIVSFRVPFTYNEMSLQGVMMYLIPKTDLEDFVQSLQSQNLTYVIDYKPFVDSILSVEFRVHNPDMMLNYLIENDIRYLLLSQLRIDPNQNTGLYINNIHRFIWTISCKYPDRFRIIHVEGKEEPCEIVEFVH